MPIRLVLALVALSLTAAPAQARTFGTRAAGGSRRDLIFGSPGASRAYVLEGS
jgi:hypothetical protein